MDAQMPTIRRQLIRMVLLTSGAVLVLTIAALFAHELLTFRETSRQQLGTLGKAIAANSTAALAFDNADDAVSVLQAFEADEHIQSAALYDQHGALFAVYPEGTPANAFPRHPAYTDATFRFDGEYLVGFQPVSEGGRRLGTLYVRSDLRAIDARERFYAGIVAITLLASGALAYVISRRLQHRISSPILALAQIADAISTRRDYSVRAAPADSYEVNRLTAAFNHMLQEVQGSEARLRTQLRNMSLLQSITRATSDRQDLTSIFSTVLQSLKQDLPIEAGCVLGQVAGTDALTVQETAGDCPLKLGESVPVHANGLSTCLEGRVAYEADTEMLPFALFQRLAASSLHSVVIVPLMAESKFFGALLVARRSRDAFGSTDCEFLQQLGEHVALAAQQAQLYGALQQAYDDLRQTQAAVLQQERLRALGQMASGIAHDINNAISPVALYTESLLEREQNLSPRARGYLTTIQRAIEDVAGTVSRMREFYRQREQQLSLTRVDLNRTVQQAIELTQARWSDLPQQRGIMIDLQPELSGDAVEVMAAENEIRDALTNLIFNAVDAMPDGGTLALRTKVLGPAGAQAARRICIEVTDTGIGMDESTRRRCLEPFFTTKGERGSGLGLAMVYGMVQRHSAELEIDSALGSGTTFRLIFPTAAENMADTMHLAAPLLATDCLRILLVDDDPVLIKSLEDILTADGHEVTMTHGGQAGIDAFTSAHGSALPFDMVITDLGMPHIDGRRVAAAVKGLSRTAFVVMLTGWGHRLIAENDIPAHVDRVLSKPPRLSDLRATLAEVAKRRSASASAGTRKEVLA
jgi:signal transduction histidine kinase/ActR/RegA family two-component response regulator/HAMP domain-containing protein